MRTLRLLLCVSLLALPAGAQSRTVNPEREYERGMRALDNRRFDEALASFTAAASPAPGNTRADGALYWQAYVYYKLGRATEATTALEELAKSYPQSRWLNDANALRAEMAQAAGRPVKPEDAADDDIKLMALNGLVHSDPERSIPLLEKLLKGQSSPKLRERAVFVLAQSTSPQAREILIRIAKGDANPDLQAKAVRSLGVHGGKDNLQLLSDIYTSAQDVEVKRQVLQGYLMAQDRERLLSVAKSDPNEDLRATAIQYLGSIGAHVELANLYAAEPSVDIRSRILQGMFVAGNVQKLIEVAKTDKELKLRQRAISHLGTMNPSSSGEALASIYAADTAKEIRSRVLSAFFTQGNAKQLIEIARRETDPDLRRSAVRHLSTMRSKEASDYLVELLNK